MTRLKKEVVVFTGAGISADSGLQTFRDSDGLWDNYNVMEVATPEAWHENPKIVLDFYNLRREQVLKAEPNAAHYSLVKLEKYYNVNVITQNIDNLHERAGSSKVLHLHGEISKARSTADHSIVVDWNQSKLQIGDLCPLGSQLRPHVVWFGEAVPNMDKAYEITASADYLLIVGTSLNVYPAAGIIHHAPALCKKYLVDHSDNKLWDIKHLSVFRENAASGVPKVVDKLCKKIN